MPVSPQRLDALIGLGDKIAEAIESEEWARLSGLLERRAQVAKNLETDHIGADDDVEGADTRPTEELNEKINTLSDQHRHLTALLRERRDQIESELDQIQQMRRAQDSYGENMDAPNEGDSGRQEGVLPSELRG